MIQRPGPAALVAVVLVMLLALGCVLLAEAALPYTVGAQSARATATAGVSPTPNPSPVIPQITAMPYPPPGAAYPAPLQSSAITVTRIDAQTAELCAPAGPIFERNGYGEYLQVIDAWPGGCGVINVRDRFGGYVYCLQVSPSPPEFVCSAPLAAWRGRELFLPMIAR